jgi:hypothetical protein
LSSSSSVSSLSSSSLSTRMSDEQLNRTRQQLTELRTQVRLVTDATRLLQMKTASATRRLQVRLSSLLFCL